MMSRKFYAVKFSYIKSSPNDQELNQNYSKAYHLEHPSIIYHYLATNELRNVLTFVEKVKLESTFFPH